MGFRPQPNGSKGYAEASGRIRPGDILIGVNEDYINHLPFREVVARLAGIKHPFVFLRFLRTPPHDRYRYDHHYLGDRISPVVPKRPIFERSKYFGVYNLENGTFSAEVIHNFSVLKAGEFPSELEAAVAFDELNARVNGNEVMRNFLPLGPGVEPYTLTPEARGLAANVAYENFMNMKRREKLSLTNTASMLSKKANDDDLCSLDSLDSDSELESDHEQQQQEQNDSSSGSEDSESEIEDKKADRVSSLFAAEGQISRLMRAVNECDFSPKVADWENYILELAIASANEEAKVKRVEQLDLAGNSMRTWKNAAEAYRGTGIPAHFILFCLSGKSDEAGGYKWRYTAPADKKLADEEEKEEEVKEDAWIAKLPVVTKEYKSGGTLRDYQVEGLRWLLRCWYQKRSSILADEMGLGKTVQVVSFLDHLFEVENIKGPFLVCVPLSTLEHWKREAEGWSHMSVCMYHDAGGGKDMRDAIREFEWYYKGRSRRLLKFHLLITTYDDLIKDYEDMAEIPWRAVIVDEAHRLKNINSKLLECVRSVVAKGQIAYGYQHRVLMTGTPLQNNTAELWSLLNFIEPAKFPDAESFSKRYGTITTQEQVESLQKRIAPHLLRRVKEDVAKDIPAKEETIIDVELTMAQKTYYRAIFERNHSFLMQSTKGGLPKLMNIQMELRKCCNHPFLINGVEDTVLDNLQTELLDHEAILVDGQSRAEANSLVKKEYLRRRMNESLIPMSGKMVLLDKLLPKLRREGHKVLIFSQMVRMIDLIEEFAEIRSYPCERLDGKVRGNDRQKSIDRYNAQVDSFLFLLSTRAGGVGINLTAADTVIIFDSDWNPQNDVQAMARCHRIGQKKQVTVYRLITRRSFEAEMFHRASRKLGLEQAVLGSRDFNADEVEDQQKVKIDAKEMEQLLREGAYSVLLEDDADDMNAFIAQDIDTILDQRAHIIVTDGGKPTESWLNKHQQEKSKKKPRAKKSTFTANGESSSEYVDIDLNDPDFWKKVLPDLVTPEMMLQRLLDFKEVDSSLTGRTAFCSKFMKDMSQMMNGILDLQRRGHLPENEKATCATLLLRLSMKEELLSKTQLNEAKIWLSVIEGNRKRATRVTVDSPDRPHGGRGRGRGRGGRGGGGRGSAKKNVETLEDEDDDEDDKPPNKRGGASRVALGANSTRNRGRPEANLNEFAASGSKRRGGAVKKSANDDEFDNFDDDDENGKFSSSPVKKKRKSGSVSSASAAILLQQQILRGAVDTTTNDDDDDISAVDEDGGGDPYSTTFL
jgi:superfamily II DNA or RNA helicase